jgi:hypothetical protein
VDIILNNLARHDTFWTSSVRRAGKAEISPYVKEMCAKKMLCYGVVLSSTTSRWVKQLPEGASQNHQGGLCLAER